MPEGVLLEAVRQPGKIVKLEPRLAEHLVRAGTHRYVTQDEPVVPDVAPKPRRKRRKKADT